MQSSAIEGIRAKASPNFLPVMAGRDRGLPKAPPVFDEEALRAKNLEARIRLAKKGLAGVGN
jgi:hypothetical protein